MVPTFLNGAANVGTMDTSAGLRGEPAASFRTQVAAWLRATTEMMAMLCTFHQCKPRATQWHDGQSAEVRKNAPRLFRQPQCSASEAWPFLPPSQSFGPQPNRAGSRKKSPAVRQGFRGSCDRLLYRGRSPWQLGSGLLRLVAVVEGEQWLPSRAEMIGTEGRNRMWPLRVG